MIHEKVSGLKEERPYVAVLCFQCCRHCDFSWDYCKMRAQAISDAMCTEKLHMNRVREQSGML